MALWSDWGEGEGGHVYTRAQQPRNVRSMFPEWTQWVGGAIVLPYLDAVGCPWLFLFWGWSSCSWGFMVWVGVCMKLSMGVGVVVRDCFRFGGTELQNVIVSVSCCVSLVSRWRHQLSGTPSEQRVVSSVQFLYIFVCYQVSYVLHFWYVL